jgi:hypothetical protein
MLPRRFSTWAAARHAPEALLDLSKPFAKAVGACVKLRFRGAAAGKPIAIAAETLDRIAVLGFGARQYPGVVVEKEFRLRHGKIRIFRRL